MSERRFRPSARVASAAVAVGLAVGAVGIASAATAGSGSSAATPAVTTQQAPPTAGQTPVDPATMHNGPGETLLTGSVADSVTAAAKKAVPGASIIRVETDAQGAAYEAHMRKADGTEVTVTFNKDFSVVATQQGFGGPAGRHGGPYGG